MLLPDADKAVVEENKITGYLLSPDHPDGRSMAEFFTWFGFGREQPILLADALRRHGRVHLVAKVAQSAWGTRCSVDGELECPDGRRPRLRTVWIVEMVGEDAGELPPRMITAHPNLSGDEGDQNDCRA